MRADHSSRALAVDVQIADVEFLDRAINLVARTGVDGAGQSELGIVGDLERMIEAASLDHREHRSEDFFLLKLRLCRDVGDNRRLDEVALSRKSLAAGDEASIFLPLLDVAEYRLH